MRGVESWIRSLKSVPRLVREHWGIRVAAAIFSVVLLIGIIGGLIFVQTNTQLTEDAEFQMGTGAKTQAEALGKWVGQMKTQAHLLTYAAPIQDGDEDRISAFFDEHSHLPHGVLDIHYVDTSTDTIRASSTDALVGTHLHPGEVPWVHDARSLGEQDVVVSDPYRTPHTNTPVVAVVAGVPNQQHRALALVVDLEHHSEELPRTTHDSFTKVVDADGTTVLSHRTEQILTQNMGDERVERVDSAAVERGLRGESGYTELEMRGTVMTMGFAPVEGTDWVLMTHAPYQSMFALRSDISRNLLVLLGVAVFGFGLIGGTVGRNTTRSLNRLTEKANKLEAGTLDVELHSDRVDELGQLYAALEGMRDSLQRRIQEIERARATARDEAKRERKRRDRLEVLNQVLRHDIRNDLQLVVGYTDLLASRLDDDGKQTAEKIHSSAQHAVELTTTAREITDVLSTELVAKEPTRLHDVLGREVDNVRASSSDAIILFDTPTTDATVAADEMLSSVFRNLLKNAVQHNDTDVPEVTVTTEVHDTEVVVRIADNGPGIPDRLKDDVFAKGQTVLESSGTGIGLYLVHTLVESYGGRVSVEDNDPTGAVFVVSLPRL